MDTLHDVTDRTKVEAIARSIEKCGWQGAPLIADGDLLITGVHRYAAIRQLDMEYELQEHVIDIRNIIENYDIQIEEMMECGLDWYPALVKVIDGLDETTRETYGLDVH